MHSSPSGNGRSQDGVETLAALKANGNSRRLIVHRLT
jgi:hypothetical protein